MSDEEVNENEKYERNEESGKEIKSETIDSPR